MNRELYACAIAELKLFFKAFNPSTDQMRVWFDRLKHFSDDQLRLAVFELTENSKTAPSYSDIRHALFEARSRLSNQKFTPQDVVGGFAKRSPQKSKQSAWALSELHKAMQIKDRDERNKRFSELKQTWLDDYKHLPGYKTELECIGMVARGDWDTAFEYGVIMQRPEERRAVQIRPMSTEKHRVVEVK